MIIECKNCNTKYRVNKYDIGSNGRMVCCSKCEYEWLYIPDTNQITPKSTYNFSKINKPKKVIKKRGYIIFCLIIILTSLSLFLYFEREFLVKQHHLFEIIYKLFDYHSTDGLIVEVSEPIEEIYGNKEHKNSEVKHKIPIKIINKSNKVKFVQVIKIIGYDKKRKSIFNISTNLRRDISPKSEFNMTICPDREISEIDYVFVKIGNHHDLKHFKHQH